MEKGVGICTEEFINSRITLEHKRRREDGIARPDDEGDIGDDVD